LLLCALATTAGLGAEQGKPAAGGAENKLLGARLKQSSPIEVTVTHVQRRGIAFRKGIRPGDQILSIDGAAIAKIADVDRALAKHPKDQDLKITVRPAAQTLSVSIQPPPAADGYENPKTKPHPTARLGVTLLLNPGSVTVSQVYSGSPADLAGLLSDDTIQAIDGKPVSNRKDLYDLLSQHKPGDTVTMRVATPSEAPREINVQLTSLADLADRRLVTRLPAPVVKRIVVDGDDDDGNSNDWIDQQQYDNISDPYRRALDTDFDG
jgi:S1-C subfamily serine protease